jgi:hypothetical protein
MIMFNWKAIASIALLCGAGVVWIPKAMHSLGGSTVSSAPIEEPLMIDPASGMPLEMPPVSASAPITEPVSGGESESTPAKSEGPSQTTPGTLSTSELLELAARMRSEREARVTRNSGPQAEVNEGPVAVVKPAPQLEELLSKYSLTATLQAGGQQLAIISGEPVEINEVFGPDGLVLREIGWDSVGVEYQGRRYKLQLPGFRAQVRTENQADAPGAAGTVPTMP